VACKKGEIYVPHLLLGIPSGPYTSGLSLKILCGFIVPVACCMRSLYQADLNTVIAGE
jgi:hypothetical protein